MAFNTSIQRIIFTMLVSIIFTTTLYIPAYASEWGCKVLLCASNPAGWQSVPACRPPMYKLIACRAGISPCPWPTCPEGGTGAPGQQTFLPCPDGWTPTNGDRSGSVASHDNENHSCERLVRNTACNTNIDRDCEPMVWETQPRPVRDKPYFFSVRDQATGDKQKFWFNLRK